MYEEALKLLSQWPVVQGAVAILLVLYGFKTMRRGEAQSPTVVHHVPDVPSWVYRLGVDDTVTALKQGQTTAEHNNRLLQDILAVSVEIRDGLRRRPHHN